MKTPKKEICPKCLEELEFIGDSDQFGEPVNPAYKCYKCYQEFVLALTVDNDLQLFPV